MTGPKMMCAACGVAEVGVFSSACEACLAALPGAGITIAAPGAGISLIEPATIEGPTLPKLRWVERDGERVLQQAIQVQRGWEGWIEWRDVPTVDEETGR